MNFAMLFVIPAAPISDIKSLINSQTCNFVSCCRRQFIIVSATQLKVEMSTHRPVSYNGHNYYSGLALNLKIYVLNMFSRPEN